MTGYDTGMYTRLVATLVLLATSALPAAAGIASTFDAGSEAWTVAGDGPDTSVVYLAAGCNPGGCIQRTDLTSGYMHFSAPAAFLGDLSAYIGGTLSYDLLQTTSSADPDWYYRTVIQGAGLYLLSTIALPPDTASWRHITTTLTPANFLVISALDDYTGPTATPTQFNNVMAAVTGLYITGDLTSGDAGTGTADLAHLDNVTLATPEPASAALVALGLLLGWRARRR